MAPSSKTTELSILQFLARLREQEGSDAENLQIAQTCLSVVFGLRLDDAELLENHELAHELPALVAAGAARLGALTPRAQYDAAVAELGHIPLFAQFLQAVAAKGYFHGAEEGTREYRERYLKVADKFRAKMGDKLPPPAPAAAAPPAPSAPSADAAARAEAKKTEGNEALKVKDYKRAFELYSEAIQLVGGAGPSAHIYYANRAAARCHLHEYDEAVDDCEAAISLNSTYAKAYSRLGFAHFYLEDYEAAVEAYEKALRLDPNNAQVKTYLRQAKAKLAPQGASARGAAGGDADDAMMRMVNEPFMQQVMQNPDIARMTQDMMSNPGAMAEMMNNPALKSMMANPEMMRVRAPHRAANSAPLRFLLTTLPLLSLSLGARAANGRLARGRRPARRARQGRSTLDAP